MSRDGFQVVCPTSMALARSDVFRDVSLKKPRTHMYSCLDAMPPIAWTENFE
eukprot:jgi/Botrbrau1/12974/Bobra.154_2s0023.1